MHEAVMQHSSCHEAPHLVLLSDRISELRLEEVQGAQPPLLISILVPKHCRVDYLCSYEHGNADENEEHIERSELEVRKEGLEALQAAVLTTTAVIAHIKSIAL